MLSLPPSVRLFVATQPVDGRKGPDSLMAPVRDVLRQQESNTLLLVIARSPRRSSRRRAASPASRTAPRPDGTTYPQPTTPPTPGLSRIKSQGFTYDLRGNTTSTTDDAQLFFDRSLGTITNAAAGYGPDQVASATLGSQSLKTSYDAAGNLTQIALQPSGTEYDYTWDEVGRLATAQRVENGQTVAQEQFAYDANGARRRKTRHDFATGSDEHTIQVFDSLVLDGAAFANGTYEVTSLNQNLYLAGGLAHVFYGSSRGSATLPNAGTSNGSVHLEMLLRDPRGSSSFVVDHDTSELVERTTYQAYGAVETDYRAERWGNFREDVKFSGHWDDAEVGLSYFGARYYAPQLGRFISPDPMTIHAFAADPNPYAYVGGSPIGSFTTVDPATVENFREAAGLYPGNAGRFVLEGELTSTEGVTFGLLCLVRAASAAACRKSWSRTHQES